MFIFIYNTLVLDVKRIDFEARMIDTLRSSSHSSSFFIYCLLINLRGFFLFSRLYSIYIFAMLLLVKGNCNARCIHGQHRANVPNIFICSFKLEDISRRVLVYTSGGIRQFVPVDAACRDTSMSNIHEPAEAAQVSKIRSQKSSEKCPEEPILNDLRSSQRRSLTQRAIYVNASQIIPRKQDIEFIQA